MFLVMLCSGACSTSVVNPQWLMYYKNAVEVQSLSIFLCLWVQGAQLVVYVSVEVRLVPGVFEAQDRNGIVRFFCIFISLGCRPTLLTLAPLS